MTREQFENVKIGDILLRKTHFDNDSFLCVITDKSVWGIRYNIIESRCFKTIERLKEDWDSTAYCNCSCYNFAIKKKITLKEFITGE
jgi:hypothetical protein